MTAFKESFGNVCRAALPFIGIMLIALVIVAFWPALSLFLLD
jgi:C4-dicarboxylate transporter, DctM subunit